MNDDFAKAVRLANATDLRETPRSIAFALDCGNLFATRNSIDEAMEYIDSVSSTLAPADKVAMLTAVAVLCNTVRDKLRAL